MNREYDGFFFIHTANETLKAASQIINLAKLNPECESALSASAVLALGASLDQATRTALLQKAKMVAMLEGIDEQVTEAARLYEAPLRKRILYCPTILSDGRFHLIQQNEVVTLIHELITLRNELAHVSENLIEIEGVAPIDVNKGTLEIVIPLKDFRKNPWSSIAVKQVQQIRDAVGLYFRYVLDPAPNEICAGQIITNAGIPT